MAILARNNHIYIVGNIPASIGTAGMKDGHITLDGVPVSVLGDKK